MNITSVLYDEIKDVLKTGDLILFHGEHLSSIVDEIITGCEWSHVGMVIKPEDIGAENNGRLVLWESNTLLNLKDIELEEAKIGPMLVDLQERLITDVSNKDDSAFQIRYLETDISKEMLEKLKVFIKKVHMDTFPKTDKDMRIEFLKGRIFDKKADNGDYFCSKLIADTYINIGILTEKYPSNSYEPKDFSSKGNLPFLKRARLMDGPLIDVS